MAIKKDTKKSVVILAVVSFIVSLEIGVIKGFSVLLPTLKEQLSSQTWIIGSSISIIYGWGYSLGLSASALQKRFGARFCIMASGMVSSVGLIVCAFANDVTVLLLGLLLLGFMLLQENIAIGTIPEYFDKYYNTAVNVYCFGTAIAIMISPSITQFLLDIYGWRGTMLLLCGINMHSIPLGALFDSREDTKRTNDYKIVPLGTNQSQAGVLRRFMNLLEAFDFDMIRTLPFVARIIIPGIVYGYTFAAWLIYIVSFALSNGSSMKEASVVATTGGIGLAIIRIALPYLNTLLPYRQLMYISSVSMTLSMVLHTVISSVLGMCLSSMIYGISIGMLGSEIYVAARDISNEDQYVNAVAWFHLVDGFAMISGATISVAAEMCTKVLQEQTSNKLDSSRRSSVEYISRAKLSV
ncbi:monocarboxylate transporter 6-like [Amphiura filiformis]|uniref:monocarboxylate transporter 6-like n=1 Tax=Amphiura filiformis TaxID=82378 RepID=UPI003B223186